MPEPGRESEAYVRFLGQVRVDARIASLAGGQHAVVNLNQLVELGLTARAVQQRAVAGRLHRIHRGVYSLVPPELLTREGRYMAAVLACGPGAVLSHRSAAALHELRRTDRSRIDVTIPSRSDRKHPGIEVHRSTMLTPADTTRLKNIPCTTVARTQLDIAEVIDRRGIERAFDQAAILEVFNRSALIEQLRRNRHRLGASLVRAVLDEHHAGQTVTWSELEERFLAFTRAAGVPDPEVNAWVVPSDGEPAIRVDFLWRVQRLVVETDGHATHRTRRAFEQDRRRDQRLTAAGWRPVRVTWRQIVREPQQLTATILALLRR